MMMKRKNLFQLKFHHLMENLLVVGERFDYNDIMQKIDLIEDFLRNIILSQKKFENIKLFTELLMIFQDQLIDQYLFSKEKKKFEYFWN